MWLHHNKYKHEPSPLADINIERRLILDAEIEAEYKAGSGMGHQLVETILRREKATILEYSNENKIKWLYNIWSLRDMLWERNIGIVRTRDRTLTYRYHRWKKKVRTLWRC